MEVYQAAELYSDMIENLYSIQNRFDDYPWEAVHCGDYWILVLNHNLTKHYLEFKRDALSNIFITKQRGGNRHFRSFESLQNALRQIGQQCVKVNFHQG